MLERAKSCADAPAVSNGSNTAVRVGLQISAAEVAGSSPAGRIGATFVLKIALKGKRESQESPKLNFPDQQQFSHTRPHVPGLKEAKNQVRSLP